MSVLLTAQQTAEKLQISYSYFRHLLTKSPNMLPPFVLVGTRRRWREEAVNQWAEGIEKSQARLS